MIGDTMRTEVREKLKDKQRIVIKIGSSSLTHTYTGDLNLMKIEKLVRVCLLYTSHRRPFLQPAFFSCQGNLQFLGDGQRVFKKHLIKISQPVKQDTVRVLFLGFQIMDHHW